MTAPTEPTVGICTATLLADPMTAEDSEVRLAAEAAVAAGFTEASVWAQHLEALDGVGLHVAVVEAATSWANTDRGTAVAEAEQLVATAERVGASMVMAVCLEPAIADPDQARRNLEALVTRAGRAGVRVGVEFLPWTGIPDLATAWAMIEPLGPSCGLVVDTWHWLRQPRGPAPELLATIPGERIAYLQLADATANAAPDVMTEAMTSRLLPGDGVVDFPAFLAGLVAIDARPFVATEVFNPSLVADRGPAGAAAAMRDAVATWWSRGWRRS